MICRCVGQIADVSTLTFRSKGMVLDWRAMQGISHQPPTEDSQVNELMAHLESRHEASGNVDILEHGLQIRRELCSTFCRKRKNVSRDHL